MVTEFTFKKNISWAVAGIIILALAITVFLQNRHINALTSEAKPQEDTSEYIAEIDRLKAQIADMQEWQDYLEDALNENRSVSIPATQNRSAEIRNRIAEKESDNERLAENYYDLLAKFRHLKSEYQHLKNLSPKHKKICTICKGVL